MNTYSTSEGKRVTQTYIDNKTRDAKKIVLETQILEHGYNFCQKCGKSKGSYLDCSHNISVKKAKDNGMTELCWDVDNIEILCRECHAEKDGNAPKFNQI